MVERSIYLTGELDSNRILLFGKPNLALTEYRLRHPPQAQRPQWDKLTHFTTKASRERQNQ